MAKEIIIATDPSVSVDDPVAGKTRLTLQTLAYIVGTDELLVLHNGTLITDYTEEDSTHVVLNFIPDVTLPDVDSFELLTIEQGSSAYIPPPSTLAQLDPAKRSNNFGGKFVYP